MARKRTTPTRTVAPITAERAARLYRLVTLLHEKPQTRVNVTRKLGLAVRGFYRDLMELRDLGIDVLFENGKYSLTLSLKEMEAMLPFPDPGLTIAEAEKLAKGTSTGHRKIRGQLDAIKSHVKPKKKKAEQRRQP